MLFLKLVTWDCILLICYRQDECEVSSRELLELLYILGMFGKGGEIF